MGCQNCKKHVTAALEAVKGVEAVNVDLESGKTDVKADASVTDAALKNAVEEAGYGVKGL